MIINKHNKKSTEEGGSTLPSNMTIHDFAKAMAQMDKSGIPPHRMKFAVRAHALKIMSAVLKDQVLGQEIAASYLEHLVQRAMNK